jgi:hypothetical protein
VLQSALHVIEGKVHFDAPERIVPAAQKEAAVCTAATQKSSPFTGG